MKYEIDIEGLPEGWKAVAYRVPKGNIEFVFIENVVREAKPQDKKCLIVEKIQPRRIAFDEITDGTQDIDADYYIKYKWWREVKENDLSLTNDEPKLSLSVSQGDGDEPRLELSVKELRNVRSLIKDFENLGWFINPERALLLQKITEFIKDK